MYKVFVYFVLMRSYLFRQGVIKLVPYRKDFIATLMLDSSATPDMVSWRDRQTDRQADRQTDRQNQMF